MAELMEHVLALSDEIGPRPVSTEEEHQASLYVAQKLKESGLEVDVDEFATPTGVRWPNAISYGLAIVATIISGLGLFVPALSTTMFALGLLMMAASLVIYFTERLGRPILSKMLVRGVSQNVIARYVPSSVARERRRRKVIIVAHVDTERAHPEAMPALVNMLPIFKKVSYYSMIGLAVVFVIRMLPLPWPDTIDFVLWVISLLDCIFMLACLLCIVLCRVMPYSAGANNNASSVAVMLEVARRLLDPSERERFAKETNVAPEDEENPVETLAPPTPTGSFAPVVVEPADGEAEREPVLHGAEAAYAEGLVPEGAQIEYVPEENEAYGDNGELGQENVQQQAAQLAPVSVGATQSFSVVGNGVTEDETPELEEPEVARPEPAPIPVPRASMPKAQPAPSGLPSWYTAAKRKAAADKAAEGSDEDGEKQEARAAVRSRFADVPMRIQHESAPAPELEPEEASEDRLGEIISSIGVQPASLNDEVEGTVQQESTPAVEAASQTDNNVIAFNGIDDSELDDLEPGKTGIFSTVGSASEATGHKGLMGIIPGIGDSSAHDERDVAASKAVAAMLSEESERMRADAEKAAAAQAPQSAPKTETRAKSKAKKPTARHLTQEFEPTKATTTYDSTNSMLDRSRQRAAVNATYEGTPQAKPSFDPFAPKGDPAANASLISPEASTKFPAVKAGLSGTMPPVSSGRAASPQASSSFPSLTGSFPSLTGSFPSLTGSFPSLTGSFGSVESDAFSAPSAGGNEGSDFGSAVSPALTSEFNIPESRFHNAMDNVGGFFGKFGKKKNDADSYINDEDDDDFGWKGGGYYDGDADDASRQRAAQIRESVVSMTENDLLDKEVWFVALGASGGGNQGMKNFIDLHSSELRGSLIINLEGVGTGDICFVDYEGGNKVHRSDRRLQSLARKASKDLDGKEMDAERLDWRDTDATPAIAAGFRAMSIIGFGGVAPVAWNWSDDTSDVVTESSMEYVTKLLLKMIENS